MKPAELESLLRRARRRDPDALDELVARYNNRVFGMLYRMTGSREAAEDLAQETFLRVVRTIDRYEHSGRFEAWLFRIVGNLARDFVRRRKRREPAASLDDADDAGWAAEIAATGGQSPETAVVGRENETELQASLERLGPMDREILLLRHFSDLSFQEIADLLGVPLGTALARAHRALKRLRAEFDEGSADDA